MYYIKLNSNENELIHLIYTIINNKFMNGKTYKIDGGLEFWRN